MNLEGLKKKVLEFNEILVGENHPLSMQEKHVLYFNSIIEMLSKRNTYHTSVMSTYSYEVLT